MTDTGTIVKEPETPAEKAGAPAETTRENTEETRVEETAPSSGRRFRLGAWAPWATGVLLFALMTALTVWTFTAPPQITAPTDTREGDSALEEIDESLSTRELIRLAEGALAERDAKRAQLYLDAARLRLPPDDILLRIELTEWLARVAAVDGRETIAGLHRDFASKLELKIGAAIPLFKSGERELEADRPRKARKALARFLLRGDELTASRDEYLRMARDLMARAYETEFEKTTAPRPPLSIEPEAFFDE